MTAISVQQVRDADSDIGLAVTYVTAHEPFGAFRADRLVGSIVGQVRRGHYAFAVWEGVIVGYVGWALCTPEIARNWMENGEPPTAEQCNGGDVVVVIVFVADDRQGVRQLVALLRKLHGGLPYMGRRATRTARAIRTGRIGRAGKARGVFVEPERQ